MPLHNCNEIRPWTHHGADVDGKVLRLVSLPERHGRLGGLPVVPVQLLTADVQLGRPLRVGPPGPGPGHVPGQVVLFGQVEALLLQGDLYVFSHSFAYKLWKISN